VESLPFLFSPGATATPTSSDNSSTENSNGDLQSSQVLLKLVAQKRERRLSQQLSSSGSLPNAAPWSTNVTEETSSATSTFDLTTSVVAADPQQPEPITALPFVFSSIPSASPSSQGVSSLENSNGNLQSSHALMQLVAQKREKRLSQKNTPSPSSSALATPWASSPSLAAQTDANHATHSNASPSASPWIDQQSQPLPSLPAQQAPSVTPSTPQALPVTQPQVPLQPVTTQSTPSTPQQYPFLPFAQSNPPSQPQQQGTTQPAPLAYPFVPVNKPPEEKRGYPYNI
jgi:hypothetical protein